MSYVDGFLVAVPKEKLEDYKQIAREAGAVWKEHGALAYVECVADDVPYGELTSFPRAVQAKDDEIVVFAWIVYEFARKARRDQRQGDGRSTSQDGHVGHALRRQAHDLWRFRAVHGTVAAGDTCMLPT